MTLTEGLIRLIRAKPVSKGDLDAAALLFLDGISNMLAGRNSPQGKILLDWAAEQGEDPGRRALLLGGLMHILEVDDLHKASVLHPGCVVIPAVVALAEKARAAGAPYTGTELLTAMIHGFEAAARVGMAVGPAHYRIWHNTATCGPYGSAMASATLLGLDDARAMYALGNAGTQSAGLWQFLETGAMSKHLHAGRGAEAGLVAASLAAKGFTGPPAILEGATGFFAATCDDPDPDAVLRAPDAPWQIHDMSIKPWPSCRHTHPSIDAALALAAEFGAAGVRADDIASVEADVYAASIDVCDRAEPGSAYEAKFSLQHCIAAALSDGRVTFDSFEDDTRTRVAPLRTRVSVAAKEPYLSAYPTDWGAAVRVTLKDNTMREAARSYCKGDPEAALNRAEMVEKSRMLLEYGGVEKPDVVIDGVLAMAESSSLPVFSV